MEIEEKGALTKYEVLPKRKLYIAVYKSGTGYYSTSNETKTDHYRLKMMLKLLLK